MTLPLQSTPEGRPRLLVVDDDALIADTLSFALGAEFGVLACESRLHAIELLGVNRTTLYSRMNNPEEKDK